MIQGASLVGAADTFSENVRTITLCQKRKFTEIRFKRRFSLKADIASNN